MSIKVVGLHETVAALHKYDPLLLAILQEDAKIRLRPLARAVGNDFPKMPKSLNGDMHWAGEGRYKKKTKKKGSGFPKWDGLARTRVEITSSSGKGSFARVVQMSPSGAVYDSAKQSKKVASFIPALDFAAGGGSGKNGRSRSRVMFGSTMKHLPIVEKEVQVIINKLDTEIVRKLSSYK